MELHLPLQQQFIYQIEVLVEEQAGGDRKKCIRLLEAAIALTAPGVAYCGTEPYLFGTEELAILLSLARFHLQEGQTETAFRIFFNIAHYVERHFDDYEAKVKIYSKTVKLLVPLLLERGEAEEGRRLCQRAIDLLCWQGVLYDLAELLELYLQCGEGALRKGERTIYERRLWALRYFFREYGWKENPVMTYSNQEIYLIDEVLRQSRKAKKMSQEALGSGVCAAATVSRLENGERTPSDRSFEALMERLDTGISYYNGELATEDYRVLELEQELERAIALKDWERAQEQLCQLKGKIAMDIPKNKRVMEEKESCILFHEGKLSAEEFLDICEEAMDCREGQWREDDFWEQFFTRYKVRMMNAVAGLYYMQQRKEDAIFILERLLKKLADSRVELSDRYKSSMLVIGNLSSYYLGNGQYEDCLAMCERGVKLCMECGRGGKLGILLANQAEALNELAGRACERSGEILRCAYYIGDLFASQSITASVDHYYRTHYKPDICWYEETNLIPLLLRQIWEVS